MTGADYIAEFLARNGIYHVYALTGGACAFMIDAVARNRELTLVCMQHEQAAAMAADAVWRVSGRVGVTMATSGPGATNLITGIACSFFDSVPSIHICGQVNQREILATNGAKIRQAGFQETKIVDMVRPITKYAVSISTAEDLRNELPKALAIATSGRMGPVLIDVPMDIQQLDVGDTFIDVTPQNIECGSVVDQAVAALSETLKSASRPVVVWGGGVAMAGVQTALLEWIERSNCPFVCSWAGLSGFDHRHSAFVGQIGVYGNRGANFIVQNADTVIVFGSRLDNRQRSGNAETFAAQARLHVFDIDDEELRKYGDSRYRTTHLDLSVLPQVLNRCEAPPIARDWLDYVAEIKQDYFGKEVSSSAARLNSLSPYEVVRRLGEIADEDAIIPSDTGAAVCWLHQAFPVRKHNLFTAGGNSPMGYAICAAIAAKLEQPGRQVISYNGDGGFQVNIQELQTIKHLGLDIAVVIMNNGCYGIIKQFQDSYLGSRYFASSEGYSTPSFELVAKAYGFDYLRVEQIDDLSQGALHRGPIIIDVIISENTLIEPKLEMGRPINDQFPYLDEAAYARGNRYVSYPRPKAVSDALKTSG